ncbi:hypothetical protein A9Z06_14280 [Rhizobium sp. YK2]|nr:hypothetical protein A9Z06_14280 [Rhizobium sp. YK2]
MQDTDYAHRLACEIVKSANSFAAHKLSCPGHAAGPAAIGWVISCFDRLAKSSSSAIAVEAFSASM